MGHGGSGMPLKNGGWQGGNWKFVN